MKKKKKRTAGDIILTIVLLAAVGIFCFAGFRLVSIYLEYKAGNDEYNKIEKMAVTDVDPDSTQNAVDMDSNENITVPMTIDFNTLQSVNSDVIGWIYIEALDGVSYPVVKGTDNDYYLHRTYERNYNFAGTIFIDYENSRDFSDSNTIMYGHNMKNGSMFGQLKKFTNDSTTYSTSKYFWIFTPEASYRYEIISAYVTAVNSDTYTLFKGPGEEFLEYEKKIVGYSQLPDKTTEFNITDKIITLSTCTGNEATRYVVQGRRINTIPVSN